MSDIGQYMNRQLSSLIKEKGSSGGRARLVRLRRGAGKVPGELPELWGEFLNNIPENMISKNGEASHAEWAVYLSLTMFALHQQGKSESVHCEGVGLGRAVARLMDVYSDGSDRL